MSVMYQMEAVNISVKITMVATFVIATKAFSWKETEKLAQVNMKFLKKDLVNSYQ